ncbi:hypothetical protein H312_01711 [Anncaliia algerae PRA339]|uniref:Uncharacterized protein n=1 Tax=Anncaliia algerae PRA339 TaxID=1288291 RepID=A0A059F0P8_9MICR|nr:hypothetical protein H312_01711 [Anncaliia algerae PRA339]
MLILLLNLVHSILVIESMSGDYLYNKNNILALTDDIALAADFEMLSDGCGTHYYLKDLKTNLVLDHQDYFITRIAIFNLLDYRPSQRWTLLLDSAGKFQFTQGDDYMFVEPTTNEFYVRPGLCKTIFNHGFMFLDNMSKYKGLRLPEIARMYDPNDSAYHKIFDQFKAEGGSRHPYL